MKKRSIAVIMSFCLLWSLMTAVPANAVGIKIIDEEATVEEGNMGYWPVFTTVLSVDSPANITIEVTIQEGHAVDLMLLNESDFIDFQLSFETGQDFYVILEGSELSAEGNVRKSTIQPSGLYYVIIENAAIIISGAEPTGPVGIHIKVTLFEIPKPVNPLLLITALPYLAPLLVIPVAAVIIAGYLLRKRSRKRKWKPAFKRKPR